MMRGVLLATLLAFGAACTPPGDAKVDVAALTPCADLEIIEEYSACKLEADGRALHVAFTPAAEGVATGSVTVDVLTPDGDATQVLAENDVSEYLMPGVEDVDGDGHDDVLIARESGNVNTAYAIWRFDPETERFVRIGEISGVERVRTSEGFLAVPARSGAASWVVGFYRFDPGELTPLASVTVNAEGNEQGEVTSTTCALEAFPGAETMGIAAPEAEAKFCAEPAAQVFG